MPQKNSVAFALLITLYRYLCISMLLYSCATVVFVRLCEYDISCIDVKPCSVHFLVICLVCFLLFRVVCTTCHCKFSWISELSICLF